MRKLMKIFMGAAMLALPMMLTSCEGTLDDVLGKWDRPTNNNGEKDGTESEIEKKIVTFDAILADGSSFDVSFKLNGKDVSVNFKKENGKYTVSSTTLKAENFKLAQVEGKDLLELTVLTDDGKVQGQIFFNTKDGSYYILNNIGYDVTFDGNVLVDNFPLSVTNLCPDKAVIVWKDADGDDKEIDLIIRYNKSNGETWNDEIGKYAISSDANFQKLLTSKDVMDDDEKLEVIVSDNVESHYVYYFTNEASTRPDEKIGEVFDDDKGIIVDYTKSYLSVVPPIG